jgi:hypothetical protein
VSGSSPSSGSGAGDSGAAWALGGAEAWVSAKAPSRRAWKWARAASASSTVMSPRLMSDSV